MHPRQEIVEIFSSFLQFSSGGSTTWVTDSKLYRNMSNYLSQYSAAERSTSDWALYWHEVWQNQPKSLARGHLYAYLQEVGYKAATKVKPRFTLPQYTLADYFQIAIAYIDKVFTGFDPQRQSNLEAFAYRVFCNLIKDGLLKEGLEEASIRSDWSLLLHSSQKLLHKALVQRGLSATEIAPYIFAWECFKVIYAPTKPKGNRQLTAPDLIVWEAIAQVYNQERIQQLPPSDAKTIQKWLEACVQAIRAYTAPPTASLDASVFNEDNTLRDILPSGDATPLTKLLDEEEAQIRKSLWTEINSLLSNSITNLDAQKQELLKMYYGEGLTQKEISLKLGISQPTVVRRLQKFKSESLITLAQWSQTTQNISLSPNVINNMNGLIDEWLEKYYKKHNEL
ncbi:sigma-70 family RNA polymerase sigma factor [Aulosira sp. FACHB-615]|nr:sigma-70 family RNA polymerase sigma factor [Aulosira sp. FACHB-615]